MVQRFHYASLDDDDLSELDIRLSDNDETVEGDRTPEIDDTFILSLKAIPTMKAYYDKRYDNEGYFDDYLRIKEYETGLYAIEDIFIKEEFVDHPELAMDALNRAICRHLDIASDIHNRRIQIMGHMEIIHNRLVRAQEEMSPEEESNDDDFI